jgi:allantoinase
MPGNLTVGMDHDLYAWSDIASRAPLTWPGGKPVGLAVLVDVTSVSAEELTQAPAKGLVSGGLGPRPYPDISRVSHREYGHRVGIFRVVDALKAAGVPVSISLDVMTATNHPYLARYCADHADEVLAGGLSGSSIISSALSEEQEMAYIATTLDELERATGVRPSGWVSPEYSQSLRTTSLLAAAGVRHVCDWVNDDQPFPMTPANGGDLYSVPVTYELDDVNALWQRRVSLGSYERMLADALDCLVEEGATSGRSLVLRVRPWLMGQPFRIGMLERFLERACSSGRVWSATPAGLADAARSSHAA